MDGDEEFLISASSSVQPRRVSFDCPMRRWGNLPPLSPRTLDWEKPMRTMSRIWTAVAVVALVVAGGRAAEDKEEMVPLDKLPKAITDAVKKRFPKAEMVEAAKETVTDGGKEKVSYEVSANNFGCEYSEVKIHEGATLLLSLGGLKGKQVPEH